MPRVIHRRASEVERLKADPVHISNFVPATRVVLVEGNPGCTHTLADGRVVHHYEDIAAGVGHCRYCPLTVDYRDRKIRELARNAIRTEFKSLYGGKR